MKTLIQLVTACLITQAIYAQPNTWKRIADFAGGGRSDASGFSVGGKLYVGTGYNNGNFYTDFWEYDPATDKWTKKADFPGAPRSNAEGFSIGSKGYIGIGEGVNFVQYKDFWEYDPAMDKWTRKADFGGHERAFSTALSIGDKGYIGTGISRTCPGCDTYYSDFWEYDPSTDKWTKKADFGGGGRSNPSSFSVGAKGYIGIGYLYGWRSDFWEYDPATNNWTKKADFGGGAREWAASFSIGDKGYIGTGYPSVSKDFWEYNPASNAWTRKADLGGTGRSSAVGFSIGNKGYIGTGSGYADFWEYTPECAGGITVYADEDGDGYGDVANSMFVTDCILPSGYVYDNTDCNDSNAAVHPNAAEIIGDGIDNNCNGIIDEVVNNALSFDGSNDYVDCGNPVALQIDHQITVELWVNPAGGARIIGKYDDQLKSGWRIHYYNNRFVFGVSSGITDHDLYSTVTSASNQWHHVAGTYNKSTGVLRIYVDGVVTEENGFTSGVLLNTKDNLNIGRFEAYGIAYGKAKLDEVCIWNVARTEAEIKSDMHSHICNNADGLVAYYSFDQGIAGGNNAGITTAFDASSGNNNGTLYNFALTGTSSNWIEGVPGLSDTATFYQDADNDGYGNAGVSISAASCEPPEGYVLDSTDCNDSNASIHPGAVEIIGNGIDDNCNGIIDEQTCPPPSGLSVTSITKTSATLKWNLPEGSVPVVKVRYRTIGSNEEMKRLVNGTDGMVKLYKLQPNTMYEWAVFSVCTKDDKSAWIKGPDFTTEPAFASASGDAISDAKVTGKTGLQITPNPNNGTFNVQMQLPANTASTTIALYNNFGQLIWQQNLGNVSGTVQRTIALENKLSAGLYTLTIQRSDIKLTQKMLISK